ncbi:MAG: hydroxymethylglutaryl-CoA lyase [Segetibacter sp.]|nr:hydroxymethylglutaryl-CoA lyase [Segetibacter sp.]
MENLSIVECPRDAMQGWKNFIPTQQKVRYINSLLRVGFDTIDCGSFVSAKAIPQMVDTRDVLKQLDLSHLLSKLLVIVANTRGAEEAVQFEQVSFLGFPFSISPTFQLRNTNSTIEESVKRVDEIQELCVKHNKKLVIYLSMGFGNPYGDEYNEKILLKWADEMVQKEIKIISLADTVGVATPGEISSALNALIPAYPTTTFGAHLHATPSNFKEKLQAAVEAGCTRIDGALKGIGGCPMAADELVGNMNTEGIINFAKERGIMPSINENALSECLLLADQTFK